jgi:ATP-dependent Clp protease protease subunit
MRKNTVRPCLYKDVYMSDPRAFNPHADPAAHLAAGEPGAWPASVNMAPPAPYHRYREMTIDEMLLENRVIFLVGEINYSSATGVIMRLLHLQNTKAGIDINLYVNSHGGSVDDTLAIYDTMQYLGCDISTTCIGRAQSGAAVILTAGTKGKRFILPHARIMIHQPFGGVSGQASDVIIQAEEILKAKEQINTIISTHTGKDIKQIEEDSERDRYFSAQEAKDYGIVDDVLVESKRVKEK